MPSDRLVIEEKRRNRFAEHPGEVAGVASLAFIDLRTLSMECRNRGLARCGNRWRHLCYGAVGPECGRQNQ
jgi:hypothetical protein